MCQAKELQADRGLFLILYGPRRLRNSDSTPPLTHRLQVQQWICAVRAVHSEQQIVLLKRGLCDARRDVWTDPWSEPVRFNAYGLRNDGLLAWWASVCHMWHSWEQLTQFRPYAPLTSELLLRCNWHSVLWRSLWTCWEICFSNFDIYHMCILRYDLLNCSLADIP